MILEAAWAAGSAVGLYAFWLGVIAAFLTAFYSWRLLFLTFHGKPRADQEVLHHVHESPPVMLLPLVVLAVGALLRRLARLSRFRRRRARELLARGDPGAAGPSTASRRRITRRNGSSCCRSVVGVLGIALAWVAYIWRPEIPGVVARRLRPVYLFLLNKWYFDELYDALFVRPAMALGFGLLEAAAMARSSTGSAPTASPRSRSRLSVRTSRLQTGYVYHYAFAMLIGVVLLVSWYLLRQIGELSASCRAGHS